MFKKLNIIPLTLFICFGLTSLAQEKNMMWKGNQSYSEREYQQAELSYRESLNLSPSEDALFNLGNSLYKQEKYEEASKLFGEIAKTTDDKLYRAEAFHNQGNAYLKAQKIDQGIESYKNSLRNNPNDEETRYNLSYALKLKQEQEQEENQDQQDQDQQDQNQDQQNQDQQNQDQQNQENQQDDQQQQQKDQQQKEQENQQNQPEQAPKPNEISKQDAERMLKNLENEEEKTQEKVKLEQRKSSNTKIENDW